jgi:hypothetical protein
MKKRPVLVPVVSYGGGGATAVCSVHCEPVPTGESADQMPGGADKRVAPIAAPLLTANLFESGCRAALAVRKLGRRPRPFALWQRWRPHGWLESRRLVAADAIPATGPSAELGLALALLRPWGRDTGAVFATGSLSPVGKRQELRERDAAVYPVGELPAKLAEVLRQIGDLPRTADGCPRALCFTPLTVDESGVKVVDLPVVRQLREAGVEVVPVGWLSEAAQRLGCGRAPLMGRDWLALATFGIGLLFGGAWLWGGWDLPMAFAPPGGLAVLTEPFVVCHTTDGQGTIAQPLPREGPISLVGTGQKLAWNVRVGDLNAWDARLMRSFGSSGYRVLFAVVFADGKASLYNDSPAGGRQEATRDFRVQPGDEWVQWYQIPAEAAAGESALVILARRDWDFDLVSLKQVLDELARTPGPELVNRAVNYLKSQAPGFLTFQFALRRRAPDPCLPNPCAVWNLPLLPDLGDPRTLRLQLEHDADSSRGRTWRYYGLVMPESAQDSAAPLTLASLVAVQPPPQPLERLQLEGYSKPVYAFRDWFRSDTGNRQVLYLIRLPRPVSRLEALGFAFEPSDRRVSPAGMESKFHGTPARAVLPLDYVAGGFGADVLVCRARSPGH